MTATPDPGEPTPAQDGGGQDGGAQDSTPTPGTAPAQEAATAPAAPDSGGQPDGQPDPGRVLVVVPTYNERENLESIVRRVRAAVPAAHVLVVDDNSPDGTGKLADELAAADEAVHVLHRTEKNGLGQAYIAGFRWALVAGYDVVVEMDADGSHRPEQLPQLLTALVEGADLAIGSRWVPGGEVLDWPVSRHLISRVGNLYTRIMLRLPIKDATAGYRAYRSAVLRALDLDEVSSQGYCFQIDLLRRTWQAGYTVVEAPITFAERERGQSKMSQSIVREALWRVTIWGLSTRPGAARRKALAARAGNRS
jgi:dolichol-phosphate mannosyltransferase